MIAISFISANYVARALNYNGKEDWGLHDRATIALPPGAFKDVCRDVAGAGFDAIDLWSGHCHFLQHEPDRIELVKGYCSQYDLANPSYAGACGQTPAELRKQCQWMKQLGCPVFAGMFKPELLPDIQRLCDEYDLRFAYENHPETVIADIRKRSGDGKYPRIGIALDTGWCGTKGMDAVAAVEALADRLFILHLKDVTAPGRHDTCALGEGVVPVEKVVRTLRRVGWSGVICIEHEPYDRDPMPEVKTSLERVKQWLA